MDGKPKPYHTVSTTWQDASGLEVRLEIKPDGLAHYRLEGLPLESFLLETDAPWLPPQPWRGRRNEPAYLRYTAGRLAELCGVDLDRLADGCAGSFQDLFGVSTSLKFNELQPSTLPEPRGRSH